MTLEAPERIPEALPAPKSGRSLPLVWLVPAVALAVGAWLALLGRGPAGLAAVAAPARRVDQRIEHRRADAAPAPVLENRHAPDVPAGQQAARADRVTVLKSQRVHAFFIHCVELDLGRHALLAHEHGEADRRGERTRFFPVHELDSRHGAKSIIAA
jgi:hypothetical protein